MISKTLRALKTFAGRLYSHSSLGQQIRSILAERGTYYEMCKGQTLDKVAG